MFSKERALALIQESLDSLQRSGMLNQAVAVTSDTVLLGTGSFLDSLGFVTLVTELEDRMNQEMGREIYFVLDEVQNFNINNPFLSAGVFADYMQDLAARGAAPR